MKNTIFLILLNFIISNLFAQQNELYICTNNSNEYDIYLSLYKSGNYYMEASRFLSNDILDDRLISFGYFKKLDNNIFLIDTVLKTTFELKYKDEKIILKKGYQFLIDRVFSFSGNRGDEEMTMKDAIEGEVTFEKFYNLRSRLVETNKADTVFKKGYYRNDHGWAKSSDELG